jgi:hypothetical protein
MSRLCAGARRRNWITIHSRSVSVLPVETPAVLDELEDHQSDVVGFRERVKSTRGHHGDAQVDPSSVVIEH